MEISFLFFLISVDDIHKIQFYKDLHSILDNNYDLNVEQSIKAAKNFCHEYVDNYTQHHDLENWDDKSQRKNDNIIYLTVYNRRFIFMIDPIDHSKKHEENNFFKNLIEKYNIIIFDEAHMLSIHNEIGLSFMNDFQRYLTDTRQQNKIKIIIMSATIDIKKNQSYFGANYTAVINIPGVIHEISTFFMKDTPEDKISEISKLVLEIHNKNKKGDVLVFLPFDQAVTTY